MEAVSSLTSSFLTSQLTDYVLEFPARGGGDVRVAGQLATVADDDTVDADGRHDSAGLGG